MLLYQECPREVVRGAPNFEVNLEEPARIHVISEFSVIFQKTTEFHLIFIE